ncbi:hypothetical protein P0O24_06625 [Methanotrichaceae archaeon M04Ac]|uniref:Uncharacterized protein n=1 Tax=Candidatus Methanocrinis alkalitolerans TaxID=3033395 RepID=A0ABT5XEW8_9EURY|nr:hypothetical protein [Candidatus Methanocrinis alkalitolerans]MDF0593254.1 hypothetical protein [Candidatus Methanocrinis alkalitolerans]
MGFAGVGVDVTHHRPEELRREGDLLDPGGSIFGLFILSSQPEDPPISIKVAALRSPEVFQAPARLQKEPEHNLIPLGVEGGEEAVLLLCAEGAKVWGHRPSVLTDPGSMERPLSGQRQENCRDVS